MTKKYKVEVSLEGRVRLGGFVEMTEAEYRQWCNRIDDRPRGYAREVMAEEMMEACGLSMRDADMDDLEIEDFICNELEAKLRTTP